MGNLDPTPLQHAFGCCDAVLLYLPVGYSSNDPLVHSEGEVKAVGARQRRQKNAGGRASVAGHRHHPDKTTQWFWSSFSMKKIHSFMVWPKMLRFGCRPQSSPIEFEVACGDFRGCKAPTGRTSLAPESRSQNASLPETDGVSEASPHCYGHGQVGENPVADPVGQELFGQDGNGNHDRGVVVHGFVESKLSRKDLQTMLVWLRLGSSLSTIVRISFSGRNILYSKLALFQNKKVHKTQTLVVHKFCFPRKISKNEFPRK